MLSFLREFFLCFRIDDPIISVLRKSISKVDRSIQEMEDLSISFRLRKVASLNRHAKNGTKPPDWDKLENAMDRLLRCLKLMRGTYQSRLDELNASKLMSEMGPEEIDEAFRLIAERFETLSREVDADLKRTIV